MRSLFLKISLVVLALQGLLSYFWHPAVWSFCLTVPILILGIEEGMQEKRTIVRNFPIFGRGRYFMEFLRPKIYQYFIESDTDGTPISRIIRSVVYQRAKEQLSSTPFGTQLDIYAPGYEWINHSMSPLPLDKIKPDTLRVTVGGKGCLQPYSLSIFNISAMSFGALSSNAIESLNWGAKEGSFAHNTGEGGLSPYHLKHGGDIIWQIGTGYFGCRNKEGTFDEEKFAESSKLPQVKMIEIKLSQGAKPGHGGILPAEKNTPEIATIRGVEPHTTVFSPSAHNSFTGHKGLLGFITKLRNLSGGKPVGFKLCVGNPEEFEELCKEMVSSKITPDFITVDGGEGGTGAAPLEFSNSIGMSLTDGLLIVSDLLVKYDLKKEIKIIAAGKVMTGFNIVRIIALGADACYSARGMMLSLGCIQALECNTNKCPTGVATQHKGLAGGLVVRDKYKRVHHYHKHTVESVAEILAAAGIESTALLSRKNIWRRISPTSIKTYADIYEQKQS